MKVKEYGALVLTEEMIQKWNVYFNTQVKLRKFVKEQNEDQAIMKFYRDITESSETVMEETECGKLFNRVPEARMELEYTKSKERTETLQTKIERIRDDLFSQLLKLNRNMRTVLKINDTRKLDDQPWMK